MTLNQKRLASHNDLGGNCKCNPMIIIADKLNRFGEYTFNIRTKHFNNAIIRAEKIGFEARKIVKNEIKKYDDIIPTILSWNYILNDLNYIKQKRHVQNLYFEDCVFRGLVKETAINFIIHRGTDIKISSKLNNKRGEVDCMIYYVLEELPLLLSGINYNNIHYKHALHPITATSRDSNDLINLIMYIQNHHYHQFGVLEDVQIEI